MKKKVYKLQSIIYLQNNDSSFLVSIPFSKCNNGDALLTLSELHFS